MQPVTVDPFTPAQQAVPDLSIVLVCWNNKEYLAPCLRSLYEGGVRARFDVVVVDNGSTDGSQAMVREQFPQVRLIQNAGNVGLAEANNQGVEATNGRYVLMLNNDTLVNGPSIDAMVEFLDAAPDAGAVGGQLLNPDGTFQAAGANFSTLWEEFLIATRIGERLWRGYPSHLVPTTTQAVGWLSTACLLLRRAALEEVGLLDPEFFIYGDEPDLLYRFKKAGWNAYCLPEATIIHYGGRSMDRWRRRKMVYRGKMLFYQKNYGPLRTGALRTMLAMISVLKMPLWAAALFFPQRRERAQQEIRSNLDVLKISLGDLSAERLRRGAL